MFVVALASSAAASDLQWQRGRAAANRPSHSASAKRFAQSRNAVRRVDRAVRPAAFEADGKVHRASGADGRKQIRSVIVAREESIQTFRSAQLPSGTSDAANSQLEEELGTPFGEMPDDPSQLDTPEPDGLDLETPPMPEDDTLQLEEPQRQPFDRQLLEPRPEELQPYVPPGRITPAQPAPEPIPTPGAATIEAEREKSEQACAKGLSDLEAKTIDTLTLTISVTGTEGEDFPFECTVEGTMHEGRSWPQTTYLWKASALCHKPLYFEDEQLERYGHSFSPCWQPFISGAHFFTRLPILPYCMGVEPPSECIYSLGHYRPGSCAPYMCNPIPLSARGALFQAGAVVGAAAALP